MCLSSTDNKRGLEEHQKRVTRVESWLDLGVLKALGEEAGYRRVDATLMLLGHEKASYNPGDMLVMYKDWL